ncbi:MAG TPA: hypothetical protein VGI03_11690 [Verrucomicrobiae bacterium]|jgi:hypothetical protein
MKNIRKYILLVMTLAICLLSFGASAQITVNTNMPDATQIYSSLNTPFLNALTWVIAATAVMAVIGWILKAVRKR